MEKFQRRINTTFYKDGGSTLLLVVRNDHVILKDRGSICWYI